jgi:hypothetical protein
MIELDAEQLRNMRKAGLTPEDAIDFPCSPAFVRLYADGGLTRDYPTVYYQQPSTLSVELIRDIDDRIADLERKNMTGPANKQEVYELKHLITKLTERINAFSKRHDGY